MIRGKNLHNAEVISKSDPYCTIRFDDDTGALPSSQKTEIVDNNLNPVWNETFWVLLTDDVDHFDVKVRMF